MVITFQQWNERGYDITVYVPSSVSPKGPHRTSAIDRTIPQMFLGAEAAVRRDIRMWRLSTSHHWTKHYPISRHQFPWRTYEATKQYRECFVLFGPFNSGFTQIR
jgi:hypothetical protein